MKIENRNNATVKQLMQLKHSQLQWKCHEYNLFPYGKKQQLAERIAEYEEQKVVQDWQVISNENTTRTP